MGSIKKSEDDMFTTRKFIQLITLAIIGLFFLAGCGVLNQSAPVNSPTPIMPIPTSSPDTNGIPQTGNQPTPIPPTAVIPSPTQIPVTPTAIPTQVVTNATVGIDNLNLRIGPGFGYPVLKMVNTGQHLALEGRSTDSLWLLVKLPDGSQGWVFGVYLLTSLDISSLPVKEAYGGPQGPVVAPRISYSVLVSIVDNVATVDINRFPTNQEIEASLGLPGEAPDLVLASGKTDANGQAQVKFVMPARWSNGDLLTESELVLTVNTINDTYSKSVTVLYIH